MGALPSHSLSGLPLFPLPSLLFPSLSSPPLPYLSSSSFPSLRSRPLNTARGSGERCKLRQWDLGRSPSGQTIWCIFESKMAALLAAIFVEFFARI